ncbi:MAG TPA: alpha-amylase family glycosyl hydrolase [Armatimonadota bacterium]|jgi:glycosidase
MARTTLCLLALASPCRAVPVPFEYQPQGRVNGVGLAGTFNAWRPDANPMSRTPSGLYAATLDLAPGPYQYKFVVDGTQWLADPMAPATPPNGNSPLWVTPAGRAAPARRGDGKVLAYAIRHDPRVDVLRLSKARVQFRLHAAANDVAAALLDIQGRRERVPMARATTDGATETWTAVVSLKGPARYRFLMSDIASIGPEIGQGGANGVPFTYDPAKTPLLETPAWVQDTVWYQVFPERFADGDATNDRKPPKGVPAWETPLSSVAGNPNDYWWGGDLKGVKSKLPYLKRLGITGIYLNPIFDGPDTHKYATTDYLRIAPEFGAEKDLKDLCDAAHKAGMRVMLDGVFNHTSVYFFAFQDVLKSQENSRYAGWYHVHSWPVLDPVTHYQGAEARSIPYAGWWGIKWMPKLNTDNPQVQDYLLKVATYWIDRCGIDGWRLDVANEVSSAFWPKFRKAVKAAKPDAYIIGEIWENASQWLRGDQFDAVMNYPFRGAVLDFFSRGTTDAAQFVHALDAIRGDYPSQATMAMFNMLGSHDVTRLLQESGGDARRDALATLFQMTYPGSPCIYYGDENGMTGGTDPYNRAPMVWNKARWNLPLRGEYIRAVALRRAHPALRGAGIETLSAEAASKSVVLARWGGGETLIVAFNGSDASRTVKARAAGLKGPLTDLWNGGAVPVRNGSISLTLPPFGGAVLAEG